MRPYSSGAKNFGIALKRMRVNNKLRQVELAEKMGVSTSAISMTEKGHRVVHFSKLDLWAAALGADRDGFVSLWKACGGLEEAPERKIREGAHRDELYQRIMVLTKAK